MTTSEYIKAREFRKPAPYGNAIFPRSWRVCAKCEYNTGAEAITGKNVGPCGKMRCKKVIDELELVEDIED